MVRNRDWKLVHPLGTSEGELYQLSRDPKEMNNLWDHDQYKDIKAELKDRLLEWALDSPLKTACWKNSVR